MNGSVKTLGFWLSLRVLAVLLGLLLNSLLREAFDGP